MSCLFLSRSFHEQENIHEVCSIEITPMLFGDRTFSVHIERSSMLFLCEFTTTYANDKALFVALSNITNLKIQP